MHEEGEHKRTPIPLCGSVKGRQSGNKNGRPDVTFFVLPSYRVYRRMRYPQPCLCYLCERKKLKLIAFLIE